MEVQEISKSLKSMYSEFWPFWNSLWNLGSLCFLIAGRIAIANNHKKLHRNYMIGALITSSIFLLSYLYYHFNFDSPRFEAQGTVRYFYFTMLLSHIVLAAAIVPFIILAVRAAWAQNWVRHRKIVKYLWPSWLYVSITGILVYIFLYHLYRPAVL